MKALRPQFVLMAVGVLAAVVPAVNSSAASTAHPSIAAHSSVCSTSRFLCTEVRDSDSVFGHYVGHDEPSVLFYSNTPGSGNQMAYGGQLPKDPPPTPIPGKRSYNFQLYAAFWYGMAMCDTQSYPETVSTCPADSDSNITAPGAANHSGTAFMELQFYPPGYVQQFDGFSCSGTQWCVAMNIDSLSLNPVTGEALNNTCQSSGPLTGEEYVNFAYLTRTGVPQGPPNPINFDVVGSGKPGPNVLYMNPGDKYNVTLHDTAHGLQTTVHDITTGQSGSMTASAANGFGQIQYAPAPSTACTNIPYDFHPMYSTSSTNTTVPWAAATYNIAFDTEIGHFDYCTTVDTGSGTCTDTEGAGGTDPTDGDDFGCFDSSASTLVPVSGCLATNAGFDGTSYLNDWPNGNNRFTPTPTLFTSPLTGTSYNTNYSRVGFNTDLPAVESSTGPCNTDTGQHCTLIPPTDNGTPAAFYPYYTTGQAMGTCVWSPGQRVSGFSQFDFGKNLQYGPLQKVVYTDIGGGTFSQFNDFQRNLTSNPCPATR